MSRDRPAPPADPRGARLAAALRANLRRRKGPDPAPPPSDTGQADGERD